MPTTTELLPVIQDTKSEVVSFHLSLNVHDLAKAIAFYRVLFGCDPAKVRPDYAKFEVREPPLVLSLIPSPHRPGGALNHAGVRVVDSTALVAVQMRLEMAGLRTQREEGVECCYSRQTKFWVADPDQTLWEFYVLHEDMDEHGADHTPAAGTLETQCPCADEGAACARWLHLLTDSLPERIPHEDGSLDEVHLEGSLNLQLNEKALSALLAEVLRVLRPGGKLTVHGLVGERACAQPELPGPAALVQYVPAEQEPLEALAAAGFHEPRYAKLGASPCFVHQDIPMREMRLEGRKGGA